MDLNTFTSRYKQKPFEMFNDYKYTTNYINKQGRRIQNDADKRVIAMSPIYQPICIIIKKADLKALDTSSTADIITENTAINNEQAELLREISILSNLQKHKTFKISNCQNCQK